MRATYSVHAVMEGACCADIDEVGSNTMCMLAWKGLAVGLP
jgi:hypothetical protein